MKWSFSEVIKFIHTTESSSLHSTNAERKILPDAFEFLFQEFNQSYEMTHLFNGLHIVACDGSDFNISYNPEDTDTYFPHGINNEGY